MKITDLLLIAPLGFCLGGSAAGVFLDIGFSQLCLGISVASIAALGLYWLIGRADRRGRRRHIA